MSKIATTSARLGELNGCSVASESKVVAINAFSGVDLTCEKNPQNPQMRTTKEELVNAQAPYEFAIPLQANTILEVFLQFFCTRSRLFGTSC